ncbi:uncharacterized protein [Bemisia tabaci]|uniref:uncharacterized protein n=1 Tax=Bemisia tabaci TaxID=7038 RepID=UPI0008F9B8F9|nr:PREDICTED: uncharacterized protein LOC109039645 [Bemisia tabaci]XP_018910775.1 PREDICTED: uncharacterized protein LOC109039645 [Bemisia tabaci]
MGGRVAGKAGGNYYSGGNSSASFSGINEEIIWISIGMSIAIVILITIGLCIIIREKCKKRHAHFIHV